MGSCLIAFFVRNRRLKHRAEEKHGPRRAAFQVAATRLIRHPKTVAMLVPVNLVSLHFLNRQDRKDG
jgi:hypothetical protein